LEDNNIEVNENTLLNVLTTLINIIMLNPEYIKSNKNQWNGLIKHYNRYSHLKGKANY